MPPTPCPARFNLADYVLQHRKTTPHKIALEIHGQNGPAQWSYGELAQAVFATAAGFRQHGIGPGDRVIMQLGNVVEFPIAFLALAAIDAVPMPCSNDLTARELAELVALTQPKMALCAPAVHMHMHMPMHMPGQVPQIDVAQLADWQPLPPVDPVLGDPNRAGYVLFTSGTSGHPRPVLHAHRAVYARRMMWDGWYGLTPDDRMLHAGALNWSYTLGTGLFDPWAIGATALVVQNTQPAQLGTAIAATQATLFAASPGVFRKLLQGGGFSAPCLRHGLSAGDILPPATAQAWRDVTGTDIYQAFGMTECSTFLSSSPGGQPVGQPQPGRKVAILRDGQVQGVGETGHIAISSDDMGLMLGYLTPKGLNPAQTGGWFITPDYGIMQPGGHITFAGRSSDMMNPGGFRVSPVELERTIASAPYVQDVAVCEVQVKPDVRVIACFIVPQNDAPPACIAQLYEFCQSSLAQYKRPRIIQPVAALPRTANGKLDRKALPQLWTPDNAET